MPKSSDTPIAISIPPEKSAYCCAEYRSIPYTTTDPGISGVTLSNIADIVPTRRLAIAYFLNSP